MPRRKSALSSLKEKLGQMDHEIFSPSSDCIYRVPPDLRKVNGAAYTPIMVSIGPYHHGNKRLKSIEEVKLWFLYKFLKRTQAKSFDDYVSDLRDQEGKIRGCYAENIPMDRDEFVRMILIDACFIIEYFLLRLEKDRTRWHSKLWSMRRIKTDLILLENQLPFFVLKDLFDQTFPNGYKNNGSFENVTFYYFQNVFLRRNILPDEKHHQKFDFSYFERHHLPRRRDGTLKMHHLCDMLRILFVRPDQRQRERRGLPMKPIYNASKLQGAGIKFEVNEDEISLLELRYSKGVLKIPRIKVSDPTETCLRNVVAFEQCHFSLSRSMTDYTLFLGSLIRTEKDVEVLVEKGIIENIIGENNAVASITKRLGRHAMYINFNNDYISLVEESNKFCDSPYHKYKAIFKQQYWSTPWRIASFLGAILLLLLTLIQTISSVIALF